MTIKKVLRLIDEYQRPQNFLIIIIWLNKYLLYLSLDFCLFKFCRLRVTFFVT